MNQVKHHVSKSLVGYWANTTKKYGGFADDNYYLPSVDEVRDFHVQNPIRHAPQFTEGFDCDDFSFVYKGMVSLYGRDQLNLTSSMCVGIAWGMFTWKNQFHACNWFLDDKFHFHWIEPQDNADIAIRPIDNCRGGLILAIV